MNIKQHIHKQSNASYVICVMLLPCIMQLSLSFTASDDVKWVKTKPHIDCCVCVCGVYVCGSECDFHPFCLPSQDQSTERCDT